MSDCTICLKKVYMTERVDANGRRYHKTCFKCSEKGCRLTIANFQSYDGILFCQKHVPKLQAIVRQPKRSNEGGKHANNAFHSHEQQNPERETTP
ncbi:hypothetical protein BJV82DRAFT_600918 [Fennellomyces sp. T-0311]|nr:hypothetical protein BJV82DRAFT_600918 [Fennellomyces sp. T-0311]